MFTGLVQERGRITERQPSGQGGVRLVVEHSTALSQRLAGDGLGESETGASVAVNGVCLTVVTGEPGRSAVELSPETLARTTLEALPVGSAVNLEPALRAGDALGGHWVQGHVDSTVPVVAVRPLGEHREIAFALPETHAALIVEKGSVTLDGVSLTVSALGADQFAVALIPHTLEITTLGTLAVGDRVNLEIDILAKYVTRYVEAALAAHGGLAH
jgi:riboflavin synthase